MPIFFVYAWYSHGVATRTPRKVKKAAGIHAAAHRILSTAGLVAVGTLATLSFVGAIFLTNPGIISHQLAAVVSARLVDLTNTDRSGNGLGTLTVNPVLTAAAQAKANDMAAKSYFAHTSPDGKSSWFWFKQAGYSFSYAGENLAVDFTDSDDVNQAWLNSPTHRANIMNGHFTQIGIATAEGTFEGHPTVFVVQMFGTPAGAAGQQAVSATQPSNPREPALAEAAPATVLGTSAAPAKQAPAHTTAKDTRVAAAPSVPAGQGSQTVTAAEPASVPAVSAAQAQPSFWKALIGSPRLLLRDIYIFFALFLLVALLLRTRLEFRLHHARHAFAVVALLAFMSGLFITADQYVFVPPTIGSGISE